MFAQGYEAFRERQRARRFTGEALRDPDVRAVDHPEAMALAAREYERLAELVDGFHPDDWSRPTDCPEWDVRSMVAHVLGGMEACASVRQNVHQMRLAREEGGNF